MSAWSIVCAIELGLLQKSSLKEVTIASYLDLDFLRTTKNAPKSSDFETNHREDVVSDRTSASIFGGSWPFIDPARITRITSRKFIRKRSKRRRWSTKRQRKPNADSARWDINDATTNLSIKRATSSPSSFEGSRHENLEVSNGPMELSENKFSLTQLHARWSDRDEDENREHLSGSYGSADEDEGVCRATSETSSDEIVQIDYSNAGFSRFYTPNCQKKKSQNRTELSEYPDYFSNVLRIDENNIEDDDFDTTSNWDIYNTRSMKFAKFTEHVPREINTRTSVRNGNNLGSTGRRSSRKKGRYLRSSENHLETLKKRRKKLMRQKKESGNSITNNDYKLSRISRDLEENSSECKSDARGFAVDTRDTAKIVQGSCDCNARRHSYNFTNAACACKRNLKSTATAIMRDIQAHIRSAEIAKDVENIQGFTISADSPNEKSDDKELNRDISMEYDWIELEDTGELNNGEISSQESKQSFDPAESFINISVKRRHRKRRLNKCTIDCQFVDRTETAYQSVFHECVNYDSPVASSSLKINMNESWKSKNNDSGVDMIHSSWRRSVSFIEECDNEFDSALLLARKIVRDDSAEGEKYYDDEHETLESTCYKYRETPDVYAASRDTSLHDSCSDEDTKFVNQQDKTSVVTYKKKDRDIWRLSSVDRKFVKNRNDKVSNI